MAEKLLMEIQVEELGELKTSPKGNKYFTVNNGQLVCFNESLHAVFANLQGQSVKLNCTKGAEGKSTRIDSMALPDAKQHEPEKTVMPPPRTRDVNSSIEAQVGVKEVGLCWREGKLEDDNPLVKAYKAWCAAAIGLDK